MGRDYFPIWGIKEKECGIRDQVIYIFTHRGMQEQVECGEQRTLQNRMGQKEKVIGEEGSSLSGLSNL